MTAAYLATVEWALEGEFARGRYSRAHTVRFDGGVELRASASTHVVPKPWAVEDAVDPEEMLVAALASCHMLTFLDIARRAGWSIDHYLDQAEGVMSKTEDGRAWVSAVTLRPDIRFLGAAPSQAGLDALHHEAHDTCFIANSVKTRIAVEAPRSSPS